MLAILITGSNGGIGSAICSYFSSRGYFVIGTDCQAEDKHNVDFYYSVDLLELVDKKDYQKSFISAVNDIIEKKGLILKSVVNNAGVQILGSLAELSIDDFLVTQKTNVAAPLLLTKLLLEYLKVEKGIVINIGSIHSTLTKPEFISYATSKAALKGLTQSMAVDLAGVVRVNCIEPAAIATDMLKDGFKDCPEKMQELVDCHPSGKIGIPDEVAELCFFLVNSSLNFLNGESIGLNGAIASRLHDPV
ncbi:SDR family oxidoreductase [Oceanicoccus sp. KOV_DT_Chl]|uniref:SDR family oxidoreductase n=1 Tax=Oceanicoccus sp. KOV_DT_Chl TaxID=1904639 RepID=UPI000C7D238B|nr:SDR family oxidoreductase [Oceanicoccus sp. KOV_DT_Chl]